MKSMHSAIRQSTSHGFTDLESALARLLDIMLIALSATLALWVVRLDGGQRIVDGTVAAYVAFDLTFAVLVLPWFGVYDSWRGRSKWRLSARLVVGWIVVQACGLAMMFLLHSTASVSRLWCVSWTAITAALLVASRLLVHAVLGRLRRAGRNLRRVAVVGAGAHRDSVIANLAASPEAGFRAVATLNTRHGAQPDFPGLRSFVRLSEFAGWVRREQIEEVWLALPMSDEDTALSLLEAFSGDLVNVRFIPDVRGLAMFDRHVVDLIGAPAINLMASPMSQHALLQKAIFDRLFAAVALLALSPVMLSIAAAVKLSSKGPALFTQRRKGADGRVFRIYKFRSMRLHAERPGTLRQATHGDPRVTRLGAFLRRTSLDELPQFLNVLRGEMSVVGPRPHAIEHDDQYRTIVDGYIHRYRVKPGITGWAQINGFRGETDRIEKMQGRVEHDLYYLRNWSFGLDMRIVFSTVMKGFRHRNAY